MSSIRKDALFVEQARTLRLLYTCEDCGNFRAHDEKCAVLYPTLPHLTATIEHVEPGGQVMFCKMFEAT
jgi:hypothetical protein